MFDEGVKVSVAIITYNHEEFIANALDSALMQETDFVYEIVVGEDCSSDNTRNIVIGYQKRYPDKIRLLLNERNLGAHRNCEQVLSACKGKYIANLDGDDYWTSPAKLQKQVDFLDNHPECSMCFHNVLEVFKDGSREPQVNCSPNQKEFSTVEDILNNNFIPALSAMNRREIFEKIPDWIRSLRMTDWAYWVISALHGKIGYIDEIMGAYVVHQAGVWFAMRQNWEECYKARNEFYEKFYDYLGPEHKGIVGRILHDRYLKMAETYEDLGELAKARKYALKSLKMHCSVTTRLFKIMFRLRAPTFYKKLKSLKAIAHFLLS